MKKLVISIFLLTGTSVYANFDDGFGNSYSTYKEALLNSLSNRTKEVESTCISKKMIKDEESGKILEQTFVTTSTSKSFFSIDNEVITVISNFEYPDDGVPTSTSQTTYTMKDENTLVREVTGSFYYKDHNEKIILNKDSFYVEEKFEDGLVKEVVSYKKNGEEIPHTWEKHTLLNNPFGTELTHITIDKDPSKRSYPEGAIVPFYSVNTCYEKEIGVENYKELYHKYVVGDWRVSNKKNGQYTVSINKDGTYKSNLDMIESGIWSLDESHDIILKRNGSLLKFKISFTKLSAFSIEHIDYGNKENYVGYFELEK